VGCCWNGTKSKKLPLIATKVYGLEVLTGDLIKHKLGEQSLDAININQVLEHLKNPNEAFLECRRLLRRGGLLLISVPDLRSLQFVVGKENWFILNLPFHLFYFTEEGLVGLLKTHGFEIRRVKRFSKEYSPFGWLQPLLNSSGILFNLLYNFLKSRELRDKRFDVTSRLGTVVTILLLPMYLPLALILSVVELLIFKKSRSIDIFAIKK
jgi:SAM-dependent methyltransferase